MQSGLGGRSAAYGSYRCQSTPSEVNAAGDGEKCPALEDQLVGEAAFWFAGCVLLEFELELEHTRMHEEYSLL